MHCIISGGGLTADQKIRKSGEKIFYVYMFKFRGKFLALLDKLFRDGNLIFPESCRSIQEESGLNAFKKALQKELVFLYIKETFNWFGIAIEYLGKYANKIAIFNNRIISVIEENTTFSAKGKKPWDPRRIVKLSNKEFIRRYLMLVMPSSFKKITVQDPINRKINSGFPTSASLTSL